VVLVLVLVASVAVVAVVTICCICCLSVGRRDIVVVFVVVVGGDGVDCLFDCLSVIVVVAHRTHSPVLAASLLRFSCL
jgi:hypothetical protein